MKYYNTDLHIHTVLSPCGDLDMSPVNIISKAKEKNLEIIGITDHNSMLQFETVNKLGMDAGIKVICGVEITTSEEIHCLAFFEENHSITEFSDYLEKNIHKIKNNSQKFGYQVIVDKDENILREIDYLLTSSLCKTIDEIEKVVHQLRGILIPAHIDRPSFSILSQLGFIPKGFRADALELSLITNPETFLLNHPELQEYTFIRNSDAHYLHQIGFANTSFFLEEPSFPEVIQALKNTNNRHVKLMN